MAEITTVARPYAEAAADLARESGSWTAWSAMLELVAAVTADPQLAALIGNPTVPAERVVKVILGVCGARLSAEGANFVRLLADRKRLGSLPEIARLFGELRNAQESRLEAHITTAYPLSASQLARLVTKLEARFGASVDAVQATDAALIGGLIVRVGDEVMDASMRGKLAGIAATLLP